MGEIHIALTRIMLELSSYGTEYLVFTCIQCSIFVKTVSSTMMQVYLLNIKANMTTFLTCYKGYRL